MNLEDKLNLILDYKNDIKNSLINKGSDIDDSTPLSGYAEKIDNLPTSSSEVEEWTPDPEWWDIKTILDNDISNDEILDNCQKLIILREALSDSDSFDIATYSPNSNLPYAIKTSDGSLYKANESLKVNHTWDRTKDKPWGNSATRYLIFYYYDNGSNTYKLPLLGLARSNSDLYYYFKIGIGENLSGGALAMCTRLRAIDIADGYDFKHIDFTDSSSSSLFTRSMYSVVHIPTDLSLYPDYVPISAFAYSPNLLKLPIKFGQQENISNGFNGFTSTSIDAEVDLSTVDASLLTNTNVFTGDSYAPRKIKGILDFTNYTLTSLNLFNRTMSYTMTRCKIIFPSTCSNITLFGGYDISAYNTSTGLLDDESIIFMAENAPVVTSCTLDFPATYLARIRDMKDKIEYNGAEYTVYELFKAKGYSFNKESEWF